jgi:acyl carrier protein
MRNLASLERKLAVTSNADEIQGWLVQRISGLVGIRPETVDPQKPIRNFGLDSLALARLTFALEEWQGFKFSEYPLDEYPTIDELARYVAQEVGKCN